MTPRRRMWLEGKQKQSKVRRDNSPLLWLIPGMLAQQRTADAAELGAVGSLIKATPVMF